MIRIPSIFKLISLNGVQTVCNRQISTQGFPLQFKATPALWAEPLKKKKKMDPLILKAREERKKKRVMKEIRKLQKLERQLKPVNELQVPQCIILEPEKRQRRVNIPEEVADERLLLLKKWAKHKLMEYKSDEKTLARLMDSQQKALNELRLVSEDLYQAAVQIDPNLIPFKFQGPVETPPKEDYQIPDGAYLDMSRKWV